jgi:hypothetical protein
LRIHSSDNVDGGMQIKTKNIKIKPLPGENGEGF